MSIDRFYTTSFSVLRTEWSGDSSAETLVPDAFSGHIQQATAEYAEGIGESLGLTFLIWCAIDTDVEIGDTVTIASGDFAGTYTIKNEKLNAIGANKHLQLTAIRVAR